MKKNVGIAIAVIALIFLGVILYINLVPKEVVPPEGPSTGPTEQPPTPSEELIPPSEEPVPAPPPEGELPPGTDEGEEPPAPSAEIMMEPMNDLGQHGSAWIDKFDGKTRVTVRLMGAPVDVKQPVRIYAGSCADLRAVKYSLNPLEDGFSETLLDVSYDELASVVPLALNIAESVDKLDVSVACGEIISL